MVKLTIKATFILIVITAASIMILRPDWVIAGIPKSQRDVGNVNSLATCPDGTYSIDDQQGICKAQPTGCPNGDSLPAEKCADQNANVYNQDQTSDPVPSLPFVGK